MTREELVKAITHAVTLYVDSPEYFDANPQLRINPATFDVVAVNGKDAYTDIADSVEAIEDEAAAQGDETEDATDFQASQDPDFYAIKDYVVKESDGRLKVDVKAVERLAESYIK
ncbi:MAG: hypothetical protein K2J63_03355 [Muribaculaceae bacterium]|nr:hypothetical protein [Muribaculaceae bacterium]MDE6794324.1 hypothetical protein [Muribaculaceae bacterium]